MPIPTLQLVLNDPVATDWLRPLVEAGLDGVQLRVRDLTTRRLLAHARELMAAFPDLDIAINGRADIALAAGIGAVHLPSHGLPTGDVRRIAPHVRISRSAHSLNDAIAAETAGADAVTFGHVFASASHPDVPGAGIDALEAVVRTVSVPVVAIGGMAPANVAAVRRAGAAGIAVIGAITTATHPAAVVRRFLEEWTSCD